MSNFEKLYVKKRRGRTELVDYNKITARIKRLCWGLNMEFIDLANIVRKVIDGLYSGVSTWELDNLAAETCAVMSTIHPDYGTLAARIFVSNLHKETDKDFSVVVEKLHKNVHRKKKCPMPLVSDEFYNDVMANRDALDAAIIYDRDFSFTYFGLKTLEKAYLLRCGGKIVERPQHLLMRVAVALHGRDVPRILETYEAMSRKYFIHATPTLFNAGTKRAGLSSCFLLTATSEDDSIDNIYKLLGECAVISKYSGGIGISIHDIRAEGSLIMSTNGKSEGIIPLLKVFDKSAQYVTQSNKRPGSIAVFLEPWHPEVEEFIKLKVNHGKEEERAKNLFYGLWIPDLFMEKAMKGEEWCLFCPNEAPGLSEVYGKDFENLYYHYEKEGMYRKKISAQKLLQDIIEAQMRTGVPYMCYKDAANRKNNQKHMGTIRGSNLCVEVMQYTSSIETAVCFTAETRVLTKNGIRYITECDGEEIFSPFADDTNLQRVDNYTRCKLINNGVKSVYEVETFGNAPIKATENHKFLVMQSRNYTTKTNTYVWKELKNIIPGEFISVELPTSLPGYNIIIDSDIDDDFLVAGWILGDGWQLQNGYGVCFGPSEIYAQSIVIAKMNEWHMKAPKIKCGKMMPVKAYTQKNGVVNWSSTKTTFMQFLRDTFGFVDGKGPTKRISQKIFTATPAKIASFLSGLFSADGTVQFRRNRLEVGLSSSSQHLLYDVQALLTCFGIKSNVFYGEVKGRGRSQGRLCICGKPNITNFMKSINFMLCPPKQMKLKEGLLSNPWKVDMSGRTFVKVKSLNYAGELPVYDLSLEKHNNFVANNMVVHNCNLGSLCLPTFVKQEKGMPPEFDFNMLYEMTRIVTRNLDRVVEVTHYPVEKAMYSNLRHRPMGIGVSGLADAFSLMRFPFDSAGARDLNKKIFETIAYAAYSTSCDLAKELGPYETYEGSEFSKGKFQWNLWEEETGKKISHSGMWDWDALREKVLKYGMRNSLLTATMPTASTSQIMGVAEAFEPLGSNVYKRITLSGEFPVINQHLLKDLCERGLWNEDLKNKIIENEGSVQKIGEIPEEIRQLYKITWDLSQKIIIDLAVDRGPYIDQSQSMNVFLGKPTFAAMTSLHFYAWRMGLKTGMYYLKQKPPTKPLQITLQKGKRNIMNKEVTDAKKTIEPKLIIEPQSEADSEEDEEERIMACTRDQSGNCLSCSA